MPGAKAIAMFLVLLAGCVLASCAKRADRAGMDAQNAQDVRSCRMTASGERAEGRLTGRWVSQPEVVVIPGEVVHRLDVTGNAGSQFMLWFYGRATPAKGGGWQVMERFQGRVDYEKQVLIVTERGFDREAGEPRLPAYEQEPMCEFGWRLVQDSQSLFVRAADATPIEFRPWRPNGGNGGKVSVGGEELPTDNPFHEARLAKQVRKAYGRIDSYRARWRVITPAGAGLPGKEAFLELAFEREGPKVMVSTRRYQHTEGQQQELKDALLMVYVDQELTVLRLRRDGSFSEVESKQPSRPLSAALSGVLGHDAPVELPLLLRAKNPFSQMAQWPFPFSVESVAPTDGQEGALDEPGVGLRVTTPLAY